MVDETPQANPPAHSRRVQAVLAWLLAGWMGLLAVLYFLPGDKTPWGEYLTIWPPILWWVPATLLALPLLWKSKRPPAIALIAAVVLFALLHIEWRSLIRVGHIPRSENSIRVITWNVGGGYVSRQQLLDALATLEPDIILLQESPDGSGVFTPEELTGFFDGWVWADSGDCGVLSRWPIEPLDTERVGPWEPPQMLAVQLPDGDSILLVNVRLMLPSLELLPISSAARQRLAADNRARVSQYPALADLIERRLAERDYRGVILGGDFNTILTAPSLKPLRAVVRDTWRDAGRGRGGTVTRDFPVARVDGIFVGGDLRPAQAFVARLPLSDHRPVVADLELSNSR